MVSFYLQFVVVKISLVHAVVVVVADESFVFVAASYVVVPFVVVVFVIIIVVDYLILVVFVFELLVVDLAHHLEPMLKMTYP